MKEEKIQEIYFDILRRLYKESTPPADFDELMEEVKRNNDKDGQGRLKIPYEDYEIDRNRYDEIVEEELGRHKLTYREKEALKFLAYLGAGPKSK